MGIDVREAEVADAGALVPLLFTLGYETSEAVLRRRVVRLRDEADHAVFVADLTLHGIVGVLHTCLRVSLLAPARVEVRAISVATSARRQGVARALLQRAEAWARSRGLDDVWILGGSARRDLAEFCRHVGYVANGDLRTWRRDLGTKPMLGDPTLND